MAAAEAEEEEAPLSAMDAEEMARIHEARGSRIENVFDLPVTFLDDETFEDLSVSWNNINIRSGDPINDVRSGGICYGVRMIFTIKERDFQKKKKIGRGAEKVLEPCCF